MLRLKGLGWVQIELRRNSAVRRTRCGVAVASDCDHASPSRSKKEGGRKSTTPHPTTGSTRAAGARRARDAATAAAIRCLGPLVNAPSTSSAIADAASSSPPTLRPFLPPEIFGPQIVPTTLTETRQRLSLPRPPDFEFSPVVLAHGQPHALVRAIRLIDRRGRVAMTEQYRNMSPGRISIRAIQPLRELTTTYAG